MIGLVLGPSVMMQLGPFRFALSTAAYQELRRSSEYRWGSQDRFGMPPALQYTGPGAESITLTGVIFPEFMGGTGQIEAMRDVAVLGLPQLLIDGNGNLLGEWVIEGIDEGATVFAAGGVPRRQEFTVNLKRREP